ncbi:MAG: N-acetylneuraminate synthase [Rhodobacteraceae bacterium]|nr:N-acetylneuraminate synthase [Paracoccaceae bacterium]
MTPEYSIQLGERRVSGLDPCYVIAEIGVNHNGSAELAHELVDAAKKSGADAVKFQAFRTDALVRAGTRKADYQADQTGSGTQDEMLRRLELPVEAFAGLKQHCLDVEIDFMCTAFDEQSLADVIALSPICLKWPSGELNNIGLLRQAAQAGLPVLLSTGMGTVDEISSACDLLRREGCDQIVVLQCVSNYPARIEDQNLRTIPQMARAFNCPTGFSDHTEGPYAALAARALGMAVLEKHFTLDRTMEGPDHQASIEPDGFAQMVLVLRQIEAGLGDGKKRPMGCEEDVRQVARKSLVFRSDLPAGHVISDQDITAKRPGTGVAPDQIERFIGRALMRSVVRDEQLGVNHVG